MYCKVESRLKTFVEHMDSMVLSVLMYVVIAPLSRH